MLGLNSGLHAWQQVLLPTEPEDLVSTNVASEIDLFRSLNYTDAP